VLDSKRPIREADNPTRRLISRDPRIAMQLTTERCLTTAAAKVC
jgi:hypothetical protein